MQTSKKPLILLLLALIPIAILMAWMFRHYNTSPFYPGYNFPSTASTAVWPDTGTVWKLSGTRAVCLNLTNGEVSRVHASGDFMSLRDSRGVGYEVSSSSEHKLQLVSREGSSHNTKTICELDSYLDFKTVFADRYLLKVGPDQVTALDAQAGEAANESLMTFDAPGLQPFPTDALVVTERSVFFLPCSAGASMLVRACTIEAGQIKELANWPVGGSRAQVTTYKGNILSLAPNRKSIELRTFEDLNSAQQLTVDSDILSEWNTAVTHRSTLTYSELTTGKFQTVRLSDLSPIRELDELQPLDWQRGQRDPQSANTLSLFMLTKKDNLVVYDEVKEQVTARFTFDREYWDAHQINDHQVAVTSNRWGGMIQVLDIPSQQTVAMYYPMFWPLVAAVVLSIIVILWCLLWLRNSARLELPLAVDWIVLACVLILPALYRMLSYDMWSTYSRFSVTIVQAGVITGLFAIACYLYYGSLRWPYRLIAWFAFVALVGFGLMGAHYTSPTVMQEFPGQALLHFSAVAALSLLAAALCRPLLVRVFFASKHEHGDEHGDEHEGRDSDASMTKSTHKRVRMIDWFALTTAIAIILAGLTLSQQEIDALKSSISLAIAGRTTDLVGIVILSIQVVVTQCLAVILWLTRKRIAQQIGFALGVVACITLIVDPTILLVDPSYYLKIFSIAMLLRIVSLTYLLTSAWLWRMRLKAAQPVV